MGEYLLCLEDLTLQREIRDIVGISIIQHMSGIKI